MSETATALCDNTCGLSYDGVCSDGATSTTYCSGAEAFPAAGRGSCQVAESNECEMGTKKIGTKPSSWTLGVPHARRALSHCSSQQAAQNQGVEQTFESRALAHVMGTHRCFELRLGPIVRARPQTSRESTELSAWITMLFVQTFRAVELPVRACHKIKHEHSSAAWEARRRHNPPRARA